MYLKSRRLLCAVAVCSLTLVSAVDASAKPAMNRKPGLSALPGFKLSGSTTLYKKPPVQNRR
jgi:hypothetical protein